MPAVMLLNFAVNFLLLKGTERLSGETGRTGSILVASVLGAAYAGGCMLPGFRFLSGIHWRVVSLCLMSFLAFGWSRLTWKQSGIFILLTMALGGTALAAGRGDGWPLLFLALGIRLLSQYAFGGNRRLLSVRISGAGKTVYLTALLDTGNELRDPITGERVLVIGEQAARELTGLTAAELRDPLTTAASGRIPGLRLIPYRSVGAENGMLLAKRFPCIRIGGREGAGVVAFAPQKLGEDAYQALVGGV